MDVRKINVANNIDEPFGFLPQFSFASWSDITLTIIGAVSAMLSGICTPGIVILYGNLADIFLQFQIATSIHVENDTSATPVGFRKHLLTSVTPEELARQTVNFAISSATLGLAQLVFTATFVACLNIAALNQICRARKIHFKALLQQNISWLSQQEPDQLARMSIKEIHSLQIGLGNQFGNFIATSCAAVSCIVVSMYHSYQLTSSLIAVVPIIAIQIYVTRRIINNIKKLQINYYRSAQIVVRDCLQHLKSVMAFSKEKHEVDRFVRKLARVEHCDIIRGSVVSITGATLWVVMYGMYGFAFWYGVGLLKADDDYSVASLIIVTFCTHIAIYHIFQIPPALHASKKATTAATQIWKTFENTSRVCEKQTIEEPIKTLAFEKATFRYFSSPKLILNSASFILNEGTTTALIGPQGSGKTSCLSLMHKFFDLQEGRINLNGINICDIDTLWLRLHIGYAQQCPVLFGSTPIESITCYSPHKDLKRAKSVVDVVGIDPSILKFTENLFLIWELPIDQRQRLALARILYRQPDVLMMDNCLSALSSKSEEEIYHRIRTLNHNLTIIIVTNNPRILCGVQKILYLEDGKIDECSSVEELIHIHPEAEKLFVERNGTIDNFEIETMAKCINKQPTCGSTSSHTSSFFDKHYQELFRSGLIQLGQHSALHQSPDVSTVSHINNNIELIKLIKVLLCDRKKGLYYLLITMSSIILGLNLPMYTVLFGETLSLIALQNIATLPARFSYFTTMFFIAGFVAGLCKIIQDSTLSIVESKLATKIRRDTLRQMLYKKMEWFDTERKTICELLSMLRKSPNIQREGVRRLVFLMETLSSLTVSIFLSIFYNWKLGFATHIFTPLIFSLFIYNRILVERRARHHFESLNEMKKTITESVKHAEVIAALTLESALMKCYDRNVENTIINYHGIKFQAFIHGCCVALPQVAYAVVIFYGGYMLRNDEIEVATVFKVTEAIILGTLLIGHLVLPMASNIRWPESSQSFVDILDSNYNQSKESHTKISGFAGRRIAFEDVSFNHSYYAAIPKIYNLNLEINSGERVAFVGRPYSGVSIPIQLLLGFYKFTSGEIFFDDRRLSDYDSQMLRGQMGIVESEPKFFSESIVYNINYGTSSNSTTATIIAVTKRVQLYEFIRSLPKGYSTILDEEQIKLTVSQKIKLSLARALLRNPKILLFENLKHCETDYAQRRLEKIILLESVDRICIASTHDPSSVMRIFPRLIFVNRGTIMESGNHAELLASNGHYSDLWRDIQTNSK